MGDLTRRTRARWAISPCRSTVEKKVEKKISKTQKCFCKRPAPAPPSRHAWPPRSHRTYPPPTGRGPHFVGGCFPRTFFAVFSVFGARGATPGNGYATAKKTAANRAVAPFFSKDECARQLQLGAVSLHQIRGLPAPARPQRLACPQSHQRAND